MPSSALSPHDAGTLYAALQAGPLAGSAITVLHIGAAHSSVASGTGPQPHLLRTLDVGSYATAAACLRHQPPTGAEMENAIATVEDAVMPLRSALAEGSVLYTADAGIRQIALQAGIAAQPDMELPLDAVERVFQRVAARSLGAPAVQPQDPEDEPAFVATLLILREFLQHLGFGHIAIRPESAY
ncbi:hypothetical protein M4R22_12330 [Acidovorax sp. GBBC 3334]|uniref:hypothetical protein n=1 Tax=unclassified Acidovorax TaxID=2684926 RepID=UPI00230451F6|nr:MULTISPECIES: hypothetical protein [unclassified Acidovorax]MDA8455552.1 hypothetical protein [Acidovorax sp. GBBC 3334]MDA8522673.1 hypothetical protein [Acidovorax sp. NCPPB 4044]